MFSTTNFNTHCNTDCNDGNFNNFSNKRNMKLESLKTIRDRLNANKSRLAQETRIKLTKTLNHGYIQELEELIQEDQEKIKIWKELQEELQKNI